MRPLDRSFKYAVASKSPPCGWRCPHGHPTKKVPCNNLTVCFFFSLWFPPYLQEFEPSKGRLLVLSYQNQKLELVAQREVKGAVYALEPFQGKLLCTVNSRVVLWKWSVPQGAANGHELVDYTSIPVQVLSLYLATR